MLCKNCAKEIYSNLTLEEKAIIFGLRHRQLAADSIKTKLGAYGDAISDTVEATSFTKIHHFIHEVCTKAKTRLYVSFLFRLGIVVRKKEDHSWVYSLSPAGEMLADLIEKDSDDKQAIRKILSVSAKEKSRASSSAEIEDDAVDEGDTPDESQPTEGAGA